MTTTAPTHYLVTLLLYLNCTTATIQIKRTHNTACKAFTHYVKYGTADL